MDWVQILSEWDKSQNAILVASLAGLSLASSSFLFSLKSGLEQKRRNINQLASDDENIRNKFKPDLDSISKDIEEIEDAVRNLINAFYFFIAALVLSLGIDPLIDQDLANRGLPIIGDIASEADALLPWLKLDVGSYAILIIGGIIALIRAGRVIKKRVAKANKAH